MTSLSFRLKEDLKVVIDGANLLKKPCRIWTEILSRKDNFFIVRYKLYEVCSFMKITIIYENEHLGDSPYIINSKIFSDDCSHPKKTINSFLDSWKCGPAPKLLESQLKEFKQINWNKNRNMVNM